MVCIGTPTKEEISQNPREFAIYTQLTAAKNNDVVLDDVNKMGEKFGAKKVALNGNNEISFADFVKAFQRNSQVDKSQGNCYGYAAHSKDSKLVPFMFNRDELGDEDIRIAIMYAGICHSDLHQVWDEWGGSIYPMVPGHEIVGVVTDFGSKVSGWKVGDLAGIGCMVQTHCGQTCDNCVQNDEQYCLEGHVSTYNDRDLQGKPTYGGYSTHITCHQHFVLKMPKSLDLAAATPLLCAGITTYSPMRYFGLDKAGMKIGVMGLGGLGHMAVKFGKAFGCKVIVLSTTPSKKEEALNVLGADEFLVTKDEQAMKNASRTFDGIVDTVSAEHNIDGFLSLLKPNGKFVLVGAPPSPFPLSAFSLLAHRITVAGSLIGGIKETQEMLDFCGEKNITCQIEMINMDVVNTAYDRMMKSDVKYRFVIDILNSLVY
eukprot:TRINITY_DN1631_c0_g1_i3.p1 TRINITY_DN1631_c0_g1~~TRINITY_DN1631_c0_g1_i3.p1  ORF type:complete len:430 (-),score=68.59 TRINITY_DN1631_c0_g1_i3:379-1668(-)